MKDDLITRSYKIKDGHVSDDLAYFLTNALIQIFEDLGKTYKLIGTGFFIKKNGEFYLLSAAHVFPRTRRNYFIYSRKIFHELLGTLNYPEVTALQDGKEIGKILPDFCFIKLAEKFKTSVLSDFIVFDETTLDSGPYFIDGIYLVGGFLISKTRFVLKDRFLNSSLFCHELFPEVINGVYYLVLPFTRTDGGKMPALHGLSGSPVFYIPPSEDVVKIIGIATHWTIDREKNIIIITLEPMEKIKRFLDKD